MEGGGGLGFKHGVFYGNPHFMRPAPPLTAPPLTAIERFLWGTNDFNQRQVYTNVNNKRETGNGVFGFPPSPRVALEGSSSSSTRFCTLPPTGDFRFVGDLFAEESINYEVDLNGEMKLFGDHERKNGEMMKRKLKAGGDGSSSTINVIKGQWTDKEDRLLIQLVGEHGVRKWSQIAEKIDGRAGKQCRERWHNHLRPDIKKDTWSEEEERLLVEAHEKIGNKWAEIAKRIPGRSENAIKNHWNATRRRQNSRRRSKKGLAQLGSKAQPCVLQNYIRSKGLITDPSGGLIPTHTIASPTIGSSSSTTPSNQFSFIPSEPSDYSFTDESSALMADPYEDELVESFFDFNNNPFDGTVVASKNEEPYQGNVYIEDPNAFNSTNSNLFQFEMNNRYGYPSFPAPTNNNVQEERNGTSHVASDFYISSLHGGIPSSLPPNNHYNNIETSNIYEDQAFYSGKGDMDLMEMIFSRGISHRSNMKRIVM